MILALALLGCAPRPEGLDAEALDDAVAVAVEVDPARLEATVRAMVAAHTADPGRTWPSVPGLVHKHREGPEEVLRQFEAVGATPFVEARSMEDGEVARSVFVDLVGTERPDEVVVLSSHLDVFFFGADDNSSGVAAVVEAARILASRPARRTIRLAAFSFEELTLGGSDAHYHEHAGEVVAVVNMDPIGYASDAPGSQSAPTGLRLPDVGDFVAVLANAPAERHLLYAMQIAQALPDPLPVQAVVGTVHDAAPGIADFHRSDHSPAWMRGIAGLYFTDTANFRNPNYHTENDLPETVDFAFLTKTAGTAIATAYAVAQEDP